jgi:hypothetical protein
MPSRDYGDLSRIALEADLDPDAASELLLGHIAASLALPNPGLHNC